MSTTHSAFISSLERSHTSPSSPGQISVIVNYGGVPSSQCSRRPRKGLGPGAYSLLGMVDLIGVGPGGSAAQLERRARPIITAWSTPAAAFLVTALAEHALCRGSGGLPALALGFSCRWDCRDISSASSG